MQLELRRIALKTPLNYRKFLLNIKLVILSVIIVLAIGEVYLRHTGYDEFQRLKDGQEIMLRTSHDRDVRYELVPGAKGYAWSADVEINDGGYRGKMGSPGKFNGFRTINIGDSITFGNKIPVESTYSHQMDELLRETSDEYEVLNFGVGGYDILQAVSFFESRGLVYEPDLVVVGFCLNDIGIASPNLEYLDRSKEYQPGSLSRFRILRFINEKIDKIRIGRWLKEKNRPEIFRKEYESRIASIGEDEHGLLELMRNCSRRYPSIWYRDEHRIGRLRYSFERLSGLAKREKFTVAVVIFPWLAGKAGDYPCEKPHEIIAHEARRVGFDVVEIVPDFMEIGMSNIRITGKDFIHPNGTGHRVIAEKLVEYIRNFKKFSENIR